MEFLSLVSDYGFLSLLSLAIFSFIAGFIDSVVGGGGLIQLPALLINLPNTNIPTLFGTNKIAALAGTSISAVQYSKKIKFNFLPNIDPRIYINNKPIIKELLV